MIPRVTALACHLVVSSLALPAAAEARAFQTLDVGERKLEEVLVVLGASADLISTEYALRRGLEEQNVLIGDRATRVGLKVGITAAQLWIARKLDRDGKHDAARLARRISIGMNFGLTS